MDKIELIALILKRNYNPENFLKIIKSGKKEILIEKELLKKAEEIDKECKKKGWWIKTIFDKDFPKEFLEINNPPLVLFGMGNEIFSEFKFAIVGTRKPSHYGKKIARIFSRELAENGVCIVSGGARGIDTEAHKGALEANGKTVCILGSGFKYIYPPENKKLFAKIVEKNGSIITEFAPDTPPYKYNFPFRNRLISALSKGILVIEASSKSGTFSTVEWGISQGKEIFAIPGPIDSRESEGTNYLIKEGAYCTTSPNDILSFFGIKEKEKKIILTEEEKEIIELLKTPRSIDEIIEITGKPLSFVYTVIFSLQVKRVIEILPGNKYVSLIHSFKILEK